MGSVAIFAGVFALAGGFFFWLRRIGKRMADRQGPAVAPATDNADNAGDEMAENLTFAAEMATRLGRGRRNTGSDNDNAAGDSDGGGGGE